MALELYKKSKGQKLPYFLKSQLDKITIRENHNSRELQAALC